MAKRKGSGSGSPSDLNQKARTMRNKKAQRMRHLKKNPNDSISGAKRWVQK